MSPPSDLVERVAKAMFKTYAAQPHILLPGSDMDESYSFMRGYFALLARAALTEAGAWIADSSARTVAGVTRQALNAVREPEAWRMR
jgi:hypothetical protein